jgi:hypothetical protein
LCAGGALAAKAKQPKTRDASPSKGQPLIAIADELNVARKLVLAAYATAADVGVEEGDAIQAVLDIVERKLFANIQELERQAAEKHEALEKRK